MSALHGFKDMNASAAAPSPRFFSHDPAFYRAFFSMLAVVAFQNLVSYSVNMADNIMLGAYSQEALSGAAVVNQIFFIVQQTSIAVGDSLIVLASQYWGQRRTGPIRRITGMVLKLAAAMGIVLLLACTFLEQPILRIFTSDQVILAEASGYLRIVKYSFALFLLTQVLLASLRSVETVTIAARLAVVSLIINIAVNSTLIYGRFGFPEMGVRGAAVGTVISRAVELSVVLFYLARRDKKLELFRDKNLFVTDPLLRQDYIRVATPILIAGMIWSISIPMQTAILGHLSSDAIAANSVATTFYQYMKVIVVALASVSSVTMGKMVGKGNLEDVKAAARTLSVIDVCIGLCLSAVLFLTKDLLLSHYVLNDTAAVLADQLIVIMAVVMIGMSYQMPVCSGIIRGSGDAKFSMYLNMISTWGIVMPLSFLAAFVWKWPVPAVVMCLQSDQIFKGLPIFLRFKSYKWIHHLTR